jgi:hypothetical protein
MSKRSIIVLMSRHDKLLDPIKISGKQSLAYYELRQHKQWFNKGCSKLLGQRKQTKLHWLHHPSQMNGNNLNNVWHEAQKEGISERQN